MFDPGFTFVLAGFILKSLVVFVKSFSFSDEIGLHAHLALNQKPDKDRLPVIRDKLANGLNSSNDKPTVYEKAETPKQGG